MEFEDNQPFSHTNPKSEEVGENFLDLDKLKVLGSILSEIRKITDIKMAQAFNNLSLKRKANSGRDGMIKGNCLNGRIICES